MTTKITVSLPDELVAAAKAAVSAGRSPSVSAYVSEALAGEVRRQDLAALLAEWAAQDGELTEDEMAWARKALGQR